MYGVLHLGNEFEQFVTTEAYRHILKWFNDLAESALSEIDNNHLSSDDRYRLNLQLKWATVKEVRDNFRLMVRGVIDEKERVLDALKELHVSTGN